MNILLIPDKFKGSLSALEVIKSLKKGILDFKKSIRFHEVIASDGGDGFLDAIVEKDSIRIIDMISKDPLIRELKPNYGFDFKIVLLI